MGDNNVEEEVAGEKCNDCNCCDDSKEVKEDCCCQPGDTCKREDRDPEEDGEHEEDEEHEDDEHEDHEHEDGEHEDDENEDDEQEDEDGEKHGRQKRCIIKVPPKGDTVDCNGDNVETF